MANVEIRDVVQDGVAVPKAPFRAATVRRTPYIIEASENPSDLVANDSGVVPIVLGYNGRFFWLDADDTTSGPPDNVTLIVTQDGYRYFSDGYIGPITSVLSQDNSTPPVSPSVGDRYHTSAAPTGDWAGYPNMVAIYTRRGWVFVSPQEGQLIYVVDEASYYHMDENGDFVLGTGTAQLGTGTVRDTMLVGGQRFYTVENQTVTNPGPPTNLNRDVYYIVGPGATGYWAGQDGKIVVNYDGLNWTFISPVEGWHAYDKSLNALFKFDGTVWTRALGGYLQNISYGPQTGTIQTPSISGSGTVGYVYSDTSAPNQGHPNVYDGGLNIAASAPGQLLEFDYSASVIMPTAATNTTMYYSVALFRDSEFSAIEWSRLKTLVPANTDLETSIFARFRISASDAALHTYYPVLVVGKTGTGSNVQRLSASRRRFFVREVV